MGVLTEPGLHAVVVETEKRKSSSNEQPVASRCMSLLLESQFSNEVLFRQKLVRTSAPLYGQISCCMNLYIMFLFVFVMMSSPGYEMEERWGCNEEGARWRQEYTVCVYVCVCVIQKRKRAVVPITD